MDQVTPPRENMPCQHTAKKLTERAVDVVESVCISQPLGSLSQKSCRADFLS